ncbi:uncharacterized protein LOC131649501 [Vicia villosa]|uniref:uncharacterized protein LOC131649501 n=1 Tax=Vicia villosa TaxID=3911 RepID=UPI00273BB4D5|nr:uncharacterized protein LOC131649501 [Vicia villosa]
MSWMRKQNNVREGWTTVERNSFRREGVGKWDVARGEGRKTEGAAASSFFFTEFGSRWKTRDLMFEFKDMRDIDEVVIPSKRDKFGRRYGFVRFFNVEDEKLLGIKLDSLILEGRKLHANPPRFQRKEKETAKTFWKKGRGGNEVVRERKGGVVQDHSSKAWVDKRSFADVVHNRFERDVSGAVATGIKAVFFAAAKDETNRYSKAFVGVIKEAEVALKIKQIFYEEGLFSIRITLLGPNLCLLEDLVCGEVEALIEERRGWWENWFFSIRPWAPKDVDAERITCLRISGIPCNVWVERFFKVVAESVGTFIKCEETTKARIRMDEARVYFKTGRRELINESIKAVIDGV